AQATEYAMNRDPLQPITQEHIDVYHRDGVVVVRDNHFIDYDQRRDDPSPTFLSWDMEPGDALVIHPWWYHYSCGNPTPNWRIAVPTRWFGDDIRWNPRPESLN